MAKVLLPIVPQLTELFSLLEDSLRVKLDACEVKRISRDAEEDQVSEKSYVLCGQDQIGLRARVDEYEPESIWMELQAAGWSDERLEGLVDTIHWPH